MFKKRIYLDYAALTPIDPRVIREMKKFSAPEFGNPSSLYTEGVAAKKALEQGRKQVADFIHAQPDEVFFTSGGTEANGLVLEGTGRTAFRNGNQKPHLIISEIEHSSIIETANMLEKHGTEVTRLKVDSNGLISLDELKKALKTNTFLVSIMMVNNEIGSVNNVREIAKVVRQYRSRKQEAGSKEHGKHINPPPLRGTPLAKGEFSSNVISESPFEKGSTPTGGRDLMYPLFHTDAAQAALYLPVHVEKLGVDLMTLDSSKVYGPHGIGAFYVKRNTPIEQIIYGGGQEKGLRSGTENVPGVMGFAKAVELVQKQEAGSKEQGDGIKKYGVRSMEYGEAARIRTLKNMFIEGLKQIRSDIQMNGSTDSELSVPHILNVTIPGIDNEFFVLQLDAKGLACSTKSSCLRDEDESYVLKAVGADSKSSVRFSFGRGTKDRDIKQVLRIIKPILSK